VGLLDGFITAESTLAIAGWWLNLKIFNDCAQRRHPEVPRFHQRDEGSPVRTQPSRVELSHYQSDAWLDYPIHLREATRHSGVLSSRSLRLREVDVGSAISSLMVAAERGDRPAAEALFTALYSELHRLAKRELARRGFQASLGATTLLHEAYLDMAGRDGPSFPDRARFMGYAARVMRGLIIDHARERHAQKNGGLFEITSLDTEAIENAVDHRELVRISETLDELGKVEPALAEIIDLKFFCGFTFGEIAALKGISERTAQRQWEKARIYLHRKIAMDLEA
jgi:RNA polymerase sigma factor (TIGR02999 family)